MWHSRQAVLVLDIYITSSGFSIRYIYYILKQNNVVVCELIYFGSDFEIANYF